MAGNDPGVLKCPSGSIKVHVDVTVQALGHIEQNLAHRRRFLDDLEEPRLGDCVARAVGLKYHGSGAASQEDVPDGLLRDARVDLQDGYARIKSGVDAERSQLAAAVYEAVVVFDVDAGICQSRVVWGAEGVKSGRVDLGAPVASEQLGVEADADFRYRECCAKGRGSTFWFDIIF